jgi:phage shock protein PspC (stress-responsive transcriptional regulator)
MTISDELKRLHELHQAGALNDAEYEMAKSKVLAAQPVELSKTADSIGGQVSALRRSRTDRWLGGVCGGLAVATGVDSWVWRLIFALFTLTFGFGVVLYLLLWLLVPEE